MSPSAFLTRAPLSQMQSDLAFLDQQMLLQPSVNEQVGFDFCGLRRSYRDDPSHPDAKFVARFGRIWIYDVALSIYADLKAGRLRQAGYQAGRIMQLALQEEARGFEGIWHFSYNTLGDSFIDPRGPTGANSWGLNASYAFILASGNAAALSWANRCVKEVLFGQQVMEMSDPRFGLVRAGFYNPTDLALGDGEMGYRVYEKTPHHRYEHVILEHNADVAATFRLAFLATRRFAPEQAGFLEELIHRHDLLMRGIRRCFWQGDHFVSAMDGQGRFCAGTDGTPSVAVDNNTWAAHVFLPYDLEMVLSSIRYVEERFLIQIPLAQVEDLVAGDWGESRLEGLYYFPSTFVDPFVQVASEYRPKMERIIQLEGTFGFILLLKGAAEVFCRAWEGSRLRARAYEMHERITALQRLYGPFGAPYASANIPDVFSTLHSVTTAATGAITTAILQGAAAPGDFIGVTPPPEFLVEGRPPRDDERVNA